MIDYKTMRTMAQELNDFLDTDLSQELEILGIMSREKEGNETFLIQVCSMPSFDEYHGVIVRTHRPPDTWDRVVTAQVTPRLTLLQYQLNYYQHNHD